MSGRGSVKKRGNTWHVRVELPRDPVTGERRQHSEGGYRTKKEAEEVKVRLLREIDTGLAVDPDKRTLAAFAADWLATEGARLRPSTRNAYACIIRRHIADLGGLPLAKITPLHLSRWLAALRDEKGLGDARVEACWTMAHTLFESAVRLLLLPRNPCDAVAWPRRQRRERPVWDDEQARRFVGLVAGHRDEVAYLTVMGTGLRLGELLALRWRDVDLARGAITVRQAQSYGDRGRYVDEPKTPHSRRRITLPPPLVATLRRHKARQNEERLRLGDLWEDHDLVFPGPAGAPQPHGTFSGRWRTVLRRAEAAGLPWCHFHDLRHLHATHGLAHGIHPKVMSVRLGHHSAAFTMDVYGHVTESMEAQAAAVYDDLLRPEDTRPAEPESPTEPGAPAAGDAP